MKTTHRHSITLFIVGLLSITCSYAQKSTDNTQDSLRKIRNAIMAPIEGLDYLVYDTYHINTEPFTEIKPTAVHPALDSLLTPEIEKALLVEINQRRQEIKSDTLRTSDYRYIWQPYYDWAYNIDPHYRIGPYVTALSLKEAKDIYKCIVRKQKQIPVITSCVNDTVFVYKSFDPLFKAGDMLLKINGVNVSDYLKYSYKDRFSTPFTLMINYHFSAVSNSFDIELMRAGEKLSIQTPGLSSRDRFKQSKKTNGYNITTFQDEQCGYIQIKEFFYDNSHLIKTVHSAIKDFKENGISNVIIDVRRNPGGNGDAFDKLISIFTDKPSIPYSKGAKLRVSKKTIGDYDFLTEDMIGTNIDVPQEDVHKKVDLDPEMYVDGMSYYVLASRNTGSTAASFVNIMQYNDIGTVVGEPLLHNALNYGEIVEGAQLSVYHLLLETAVSVVEIDDYTKAVDGILAPDIHIPYVASEYLTGKDAVLEKLLQIIKDK